MKFKKLLAGVLTSAITLSTCHVMQINASADYTGLAYDDYLYYLKIDKDKDEIYDYAVITDCDKSVVSIEIPSEIKGLPITRIGKNAFSGCNKLTSISIPDTVTAIEQSAFSGTSIAEINLPKKLTEIGDSAFSATKLESIDIPDTVKTIGNNAFSLCKSLDSVKLGNGLNSIGRSAFEDCKKLSEITIPDSVQSIGMTAFKNTPITDNQKGIKYADTWVVGCDKNNDTIEIKDGTRGIAQYAFMEYDGLEEVTFPNTLEIIDCYAFLDCPNIKSISTGDGVKKICEASFKDCKGLKSLVMGKNVDTIEDNAFQGCDKLEDITIPTSAVHIIGHAFEDTPWLEMKRTENPFVVVNSILIDAKTIPLGEDFTIPENVTTIGSYAFETTRTENDKLGLPKHINVTLPENVSKIEQGGFCGFTALNDLIIKNPDCEIIDNGYVLKIVSNEYGVPAFEPYFGGTVCGMALWGEFFTYGKIIGCDNSTAQAYAELCGYKFDTLGENEWNISSVVYLQKYLAKINTTFSKRYDLNNDGNINIFDLIILKRKVIYKK